MISNRPLGERRNGARRLFVKRAAGFRTGCGSNRHVPGPGRRAIPKQQLAFAAGARATVSETRHPQPPCDNQKSIGELAADMIHRRRAALKHNREHLVELGQRLGRIALTLAVTDEHVLDAVLP